jgi:alanyl-tRNA synthetase
MPTGSEIREKFLRFYESKGHKRVHSSSLVPANDPTLLFTNAGMNQFKDVFLGAEKRDYARATTSQKCVRAGGKQNDLENVGFTKRHHTFFEMLGNFSFGDYFKRDAIAFAWELLTSKEWWGIDKDSLYTTFFGGEQGIARDDEAEKLWLAIGVPKERVHPMGMKDNFWSMGDTGPCGPCSEIHYDMGKDASEQGHKDCKFPCDCGRYVEIWNLVFMQFDRDSAGKYNPLPKPSIDTGMGLERVAAVLQNKISNYDTDLFLPLIAAARKLTTEGGNGDAPQSANQTNDRVGASLRIIADHSRAATFLISDGVLPANDGRGYVLRKILRRGIRHGRLLGAHKPFMHQMVYAVRDLMKEAYPELIETADRVSKVIHEEERRFAHTLDAGLDRLEADLQSVRKAAADAQRIAGQANPGPQDNLSDSGVGRAALAQYQYQADKGLRYRGDHAFKLYDTFGLPLDFIVDICRDAGIEFDMEGFERAMDAQRERARASWKGGAKQSASPVYRDLGKTVFEGYRQTESKNCTVLAIVKFNDKTVGGSGNSTPQGVQILGVQMLNPGEEGEVVLDHTPFYADSGGQVGDIGVFYNAEHNAVIADVNGCYLPVQGVRAHKVKARLPIQVGAKVDAVVHSEVRDSTRRNHTATHLLHAGLREILGKHVKQAGSLVDPGHLRFDFSHFTAVGDEELQDVEDMVNKEVLRNIKVETIEDVPIDVAISEYHAMALFGEKYGEKVRVVKIGDFSTELCGGIHTAATGEIGLIKILHEGSVSSGVRRVEAVTGEGSLFHFRKDHALENIVATLVPGAQKADSPAEALRAELDRKENEIKKLQKELDQVRMKSAASKVASIDDKIKDVRGVKVLAHREDNLDRGQMRTLVDNLRNKLGSGVVVLGSGQEDGKVALIVGVTADLTGKIPAGKVIKPVAEKVGGSGGGRPDMAEAGGKDPGQLDAALNEAYAAVEGLLK